MGHTSLNQLGILLTYLGEKWHLGGGEAGEASGDVPWSPLCLQRDLENNHFHEHLHKD